MTDQNHLLQTQEEMFSILLWGFSIIPEEKLYTTCKKTVNAYINAYTVPISSDWWTVNEEMRKRENLNDNEAEI